jgi:hypothetical protein
LFRAVWLFLNGNPQQNTSKNRLKAIFFPSESEIRSTGNAPKHDVKSARFWFVRNHLPGAQNAPHLPLLPT